MLPSTNAIQNRAAGDLRSRAGGMARDAVGGNGAAPAIPVISGELAKAVISDVEGLDLRLECLFNPAEYTLSKSNTWTSRNMPGRDVPLAEYTGGRPTQLQMELFFDTYERGEDVTDYTSRLMSLARVEPQTEAGDSHLGRPPMVLFSWGRFFSFRAVITSLSLRYTLFLGDGTPVRATANVTFQECEDVAPPQQEAASPSPTHGIRGHKVRVVRPGDTIDRIAAEEYGDAKVWRHLAETNAIDNPMDLRPGQALLVLPLGAERSPVP